MKILVSGGTGFIGSHLIPQLVRNHEVYALTRGAPIGHPNVRSIELDLSVPLEEADLPGQIDAVIHLAQSRRYREFPDSADDIFALNVASTFALADYARQAGAQRFVFTSTGGVYGHGPEQFVEGDIVNPINFYLASKFAAETVLAPFVPHLHTIVLRLFFVYGPRQGAMLISSLARKVRSGETIVLEGNPGIRINPLYVEDAVRVLEQTLTYDGSLLCNVGGSEVVTLTELVEMLGGIMGRTPSIEHAPSEHDGDIIGDITRMRTELGVSPAVPLDTGLRRIVESLDS